MTLYSSLRNIALVVGRGKQDGNFWYLYGQNVQKDSPCRTKASLQNPLHIIPPRLVQADQLLAPASFP
jgi:hypothetical protein